MGYSVKSNIKDKDERSQHPDRNNQFEYINKIKEKCKISNIPIISVDAKDKVLVGNFKNKGKLWCRKARNVNTHDFPSNSKGKAIPYGIYDLNKNKGFVCVGTSFNTSAFAVDVIRQWWLEEGKYYNKKELNILADSGGSNGYRSRLFKKALQEKLCDDLGLKVTVNHYPVGCSKWNPIEHRLFSYISKNWEGEPLKTYSHILGFINSTTTHSGLSVSSYISEQVYETGKKVTDKEMRFLNIKKHSICPNWNYTIKSRSIQYEFDFMKTM